MIGSWSEHSRSTLRRSLAARSPGPPPCSRCSARATSTSQPPRPPTVKGPLGAAGPGDAAGLMVISSRARRSGSRLRGGGSGWRGLRWRRGPRRHRRVRRGGLLLAAASGGPVVTQAGGGAVDTVVRAEFGVDRGGGHRWGTRQRAQPSPCGRTWQAVELRSCVVPGGTPAVLAHRQLQCAQLRSRRVVGGVGRQARTRPDLAPQPHHLVRLAETSNENPSGRRTARTPNTSLSTRGGSRQGTAGNGSDHRSDAALGQSVHRLDSASARSLHGGCLAVRTSSMCAAPTSGPPRSPRVALARFRMLRAEIPTAAGACWPVAVRGSALQARVRAASLIAASSTGRRRVRQGRCG